MSRVAVNESVLRWAIERSGLSRGALQEKFPKLQQWIAGAKWPTLHQLEAFAKATSTPFGYLFLSEPPEETLPIPHFRTIEDEPANSPSP